MDPMSDEHCHTTITIVMMFQKNQSWIPKIEVIRREFTLGREPFSSPQLFFVFLLLGRFYFNHGRCLMELLFLCHVIIQNQPTDYCLNDCNGNQYKCEVNFLSCVRCLYQDA